MGAAPFAVAERMHPSDLAEGGHQDERIDRS